MRLKCISLNLWLGGLLMDEIKAFIGTEKPDILLLQEVYNSPDATLPPRFRSVEIMKEISSFPHTFFSPAMTSIVPEGKVEVGNCILSRFPIIETETIFFDVPFDEVANNEDAGRDSDFFYTPRNLQHAKIDINGIDFNIFNTQGIWGHDGRDNPRRVMMGKTIAAKIEGRKRVILAGDFNVDPDTKTIGAIERCLRNVFKDKLKTTFNMKRKSNPVLANVVVDMAFVSPDLTVADYTCPNIDISDHLPLIVTLTI